MRVTLVEELDRCDTCRAKVSIGIDARVCRDCGASLCEVCRMLDGTRVVCEPCAPRTAARPKRTEPLRGCQGCGKRTDALLGENLCLHCYFDKDKQKRSKAVRKRHVCRDCGAPSTTHYCAECLVTIAESD